MRSEPAGCYVGEQAFQLPVHMLPVDDPLRYDELPPAATLVGRARCSRLASFFQRLVSQVQRWTKMWSDNLAVEVNLSITNELTPTNEK